MLYNMKTHGIVADKNELRHYGTDKRLWQGIPSIGMSKGGRIFATYYSGGWREDVGNFVILIKSDDDGVTFSEPILAAVPDDSHRCYDATLWKDPLDRLWFIYSVMPDHSVWAMICDDPDADELVWNEPKPIGFDVMLNKPTVLSSGEWLFPMAVWRRGMLVGGKPELETKQPERGVFIFKTNDNGATFTLHSYKRFPMVDFEEPMLYERQNGVLRMLIRTTYGIGEASSYDRGKTWNTPIRSDIKGPCSRFHIARLSSGRMMLINHYDFDNRNNLTVFLSDDDGATWPHRLLLDGRNEVSYPDAVEHNGFIYIIYDRERGDVKRNLEEVYGDAREILMAKVTEEDILSGKLVSPESRLRVLVNKLGKYKGDEPNPFFEIDRCATNKEAAEMLASNFEKEDIISRIFDAFQLKCANMSNIDIDRLDALMDRYESADGTDVSLIEEIIAVIRVSDAGNTDAAPIVARIKSEIAAHIGEDIGITETAKSLGISRYYMAHIFKQYTGTSVMSYKNELRLAKAKKMLITSDEKISDIAIECGYSTSSYFSKKFAENEGITPADYRKLHR